MGQKYVLMFVRDDEAFLADPAHDHTYESINQWFMDLGQQGKIVETGSELQPARNATTVRWSGGNPLVTDGPFMESKETVAGFTTIEVSDLDEAIAIAKRWPAKDHSIEIRPIVDHEQTGH